jgi:hypothetical protein
VQLYPLFDCTTTASAEHDLNTLVTALRAIHMDINSNKTQLIAHPTSVIPQSLAHLPTSTTYSDVLGTVIFASPSTASIARQQKDSLLVLNAPIPLQYKWLILRHVVHSLIHYATLMDPNQAAATLTQLTNHITTIFRQLLHTEVATTQLFAPLANGGLGLPNYILLNKIHHKHITATLTPEEAECIVMFPKKHNIVHHNNLTAKAFREDHPTTFLHLQSPPNVNPHHWLNARPSSPHFEITDDAFVLGIQTRCSLIAPFPIQCPKLDDVPPLDITTFTPHILTCPHCSAATMHLRHESVTAATRRACLRSHLHCSISDQGLPRPNAATPHGPHSGPDGIIFTPIPLAFDVTVVAHTRPSQPSQPRSEQNRNVLNRAWHLKVNKYKDWCRLAEMDLLPIVFNSAAIISPDTLSVIEALSKSHRPFKAEFLYATSVAIIMSTAAGFRLLRARYVLQTAQAAHNAVTTSAADPPS